MVSKWRRIILQSKKAPLLFGILMIVALVGYVTMFRSSPGELSRAHSDVAGSSFITDCKKCHMKKDVSIGCLSCHSEIQSQLTKENGYHHYLLKNKKVTCLPCHSEHNGADFKLINKVSWEGESVSEFAHPHVKFQLKDKHSALACELCHKQKTEKGVSTFLGLSQKCVSCHEDIHTNSKITNCENCHGQKSFKPALNFNHDLYFPLRGSHKKTSCNKCHLDPANSKITDSPYAAFQRVKGNKCQDCHSNPHRTRWSNSCESCHKGEDSKWGQATSRMTKEIHSLTGFQLTSPHNKVQCSKCHQEGGSYGERYPNPKSSEYRRLPKNCEACHSDAHQGQFVDRHPHCTHCHNLNAFVPSKMTQREHKTYLLEGQHAVASCNKCHVISKQKGIRQYIGTPQKCGQCHKDIHRGQFRVNGETECERCHGSAKRWATLIFDHNRQSVFKLDEAHTKVTCQECHPRVDLPQGGSLVQYKPIRRKCDDCHEFYNR